ncbi:hypothetical protein POX_c03959 [Penicillium oxalicum]|uniref:hypothetical protein n=1 Tax=Penicillium oxalicum TaxID=69781 RepID=UPI0020B76206|nr:hypothetical protein POX_c03959 [Penicillium oxalicum]KAI2791104.1 hypothetical protein POX_c03959 [Penicillium oxalicum]
MSSRKLVEATCLPSLKGLGSQAGGGLRLHQQRAVISDLGPLTSNPGSVIKLEDSSAGREESAFEDLRLHVYINLPAAFVKMDICLHLQPPLNPI